MTAKVKTLEAAEVLSMRMTKSDKSIINSGYDVEREGGGRIVALTIKV